MVCNEEWVYPEDSDPHKERACKEVYQNPRHEYYSFSNDALEQLAYADPLPALIMSERLSLQDPIKSLGYAVRSAAVSGKVGPILNAAWTTFGWSNPASAGRVSKNSIYIHLALIQVAARMGHSFSQQYERPKALDALEINQNIIDERAQLLIEDLVQNQMTVTGQSSLKEVFGV